MASKSVHDLRRTPAYPFVEAACYLHVPNSTLRSWCVGMTYVYKKEKRKFQPIIHLDGEKSEGLSFLNLVEAHVLAAIRRCHKISLPKVRDAIQFISRELRMERPLAHARLQTDGVDLLVERVGGLVNVSRKGQMEMASLLDIYLKRIEHDPSGVPVKLFPFMKKNAKDDSPAPVVIDPRLSFGRPVLVDRAVPIAILADRFIAGDEIKELSEDYNVSAETIEEAIRCEVDCRQAA